MDKRSIFIIASFICSIASDINFMIDHAFSKAEIEIPFPQRDVYIRSAPESPSSEEPEPEPDKGG